MGCCGNCVATLCPGCEPPKTPHILVCTKCKHGCPQGAPCALCGASPMIEGDTLCRYCDSIERDK